MDARSLYVELKQTLRFKVNNQNIEIYRNGTQNDFMIYMKEATYWQKMKCTSSMLSFLTIVFVIFLDLY